MEVPDEHSAIPLMGKAGGVVTVRRTLVSTNSRVIDPTLVPRPRQLRDASQVMRFRSAHQSLIDRRFDDHASCRTLRRPKRPLATQATDFYACILKRRT